MRTFADPKARRVVAGILVPVVTLVAVGAVLEAVSGGMALDFRRAYLPAAEAIAAGGSPYAVAEYVYPPSFAFALTPLTLLPDDAAALIAMFTAVALLVATLGVLRVGDGLCYLAVFTWAPTWNEINMASITPALALGLALTWRHRDRAWRPAIALGLVISAKLFLWPVFFWTLATRRLRLTLFAVVVGVGVTLGLWAVIGFQGLLGYPELLRNFAARDSVRADSYSLVGIATALGLDANVGHAVMLIGGVALLVGGVRRARRGDDRGSFFLALAAALALTPILWLHYLVLLLVPLAIARPYFTPLWLLPVVLWIGQSPMSPSGRLNMLPALVIMVIVARLVISPLGDPLQMRWNRDVTVRFAGD